MPDKVRPTLSRKRITRLQDGRDLVGVEYEFGKPGTPEYFHDTLWEDWPDKPTQIQTNEMNRRYDNQMAFLEMARNPPPPKMEDLVQQLDDIDDQIRQLQRQRIDVEEQIALKERENRAPIEG